MYAPISSRRRGPMLDYLPDPRADALAELIVAFSNGLGGTIIVGADEDGRVYADAAETFESAMMRALSLCEPSLRDEYSPTWEWEDTPRGCIVRVTVRPAPSQISIGGRQAFVRSGTTNVPVPLDHRRDAGREAETREADLVPGATAADLDEAILDEYQRNRVRRGPRGESLTRAELLRDAGAVDAHGLPTVAGILLFGANPQHYLPQAGIVIVRFRGTSVRDAAVSSERYSRRLDIVGPAPRLVERAWEALFTEIHQESTADGLVRREHYVLPPEAVREAVVNAVCHRDYRITGQRIEIRLFDDRMEIFSPGGLPGHITLDNILDEHYSRNPRLVRGLYYWGYIEELGQGVDIIYEAMRRDHHPEPEFRDTGRGLIVTLRTAVDPISQVYGDRLNPRQMRMLQFLSTHERITNSQCRELCSDVSAETLRLDLRALVQEGLVLKIGDKRGTYYVLK